MWWKEGRKNWGYITVSSHYDKKKLINSEIKSLKAAIWSFIKDKTKVTFANRVFWCYVGIVIPAGAIK